MANLTLGPLLPAPSFDQPLPPVATGKVREAAQQFEALLLSQILKSVRESEGWLGSRDQASDCAVEFAEQQLAAVLAQQGGLGLAGLIAQGLDRDQQAATATAATGAGAERPPSYKLQP